MSTLYLLIFGATSILVVHVFCYEPARYQPPSRYPEEQRRPDYRDPRLQRQSMRNYYCNLQFCRSRNSHTLCRFSPDYPASGCGNVFSNSMSELKKKEVLEKHNEFRNKISKGREHRGTNGPQPASRDFVPLIWNDTLAKIAQAWANQCIFRHDECRADSRGPVGQNIGYTTDSRFYETDLSDIVTRWYDEVRFYDGREVESYTGNLKALHYTQIVWAETTEVGCGAVIFEDRVRSSGLYTTQLVCNYSPKGNWIGESVYPTQ